ncbi:MAG: spondin domain-containing protein [Woeseiaceae bacterium]|nr:spondin domain-containing protein [Woeseiaceae bacterium]
MRAIPIIGLAALVLAACDSSNNNRNNQGPPPPPPPPPAMASFDVTVTNLTNAQPASPIAVIAHQDGYAVFTIGSAATVGLETLAEGGDNSVLIGEADADANVFSTGSGAAPIGPAGSETVTIDVLESDLANLQISVSTMLVNTNDAISGLNGVDVSGLAEGDTWTGRAIVYDAGTELNTELAAEIPGPAGGGEGFNAARNDRADLVAMHPGVISQDDGLVASALTGQHRFDNPALMVRIERTD